MSGSGAGAGTHTALGDRLVGDGRRARSQMGCKRQRGEAGPSPLLKGDAQALCSGNPESIILAIETYIGDAPVQRKS